MVWDVENLGCSYHVSVVCGTAHTPIMTDYYYQKLMDKTVLYNCTCMHKSWHCALKPKASNEWVERGTN